MIYKYLQTIFEKKIKVNSKKLHDKDTQFRDIGKNFREIVRNVHAMNIMRGINYFTYISYFSIIMGTKNLEQLREFTQTRIQLT